MSKPANGAVAETTLIIGVIGADAHIVGAKILEFALGEAGYKVVNLGIMVSQEEFIRAAIETNAAAILVSSLYGHGEIDCRGFRERCEEAGLRGIKLMVGGNLVIGKQPWLEVKQRFLNMGFDNAYPPGTTPEVAIRDLQRLLGESKG